MGRIFNGFLKEIRRQRMEHILNNINLISLHINLWQGDKALKAEDLESNGIDVSKLPPGKLANLGCKRTISREATKEFVSLKREAHSICNKYGVKFGESGYAVPDTRVEEICNALANIKARFAAEKVAFLAVYAEKTEEWIQSNDYEWRDVIRKSVDPEGKVSATLSFNFSAIKVNPVVNVENGLEEEVGGLHAQLCKEIRTLASVTLKTSYAGKTEVGKRALRPIKAMADKLAGMAFLDGSIKDLADEVANVHFQSIVHIKNSAENVLDGKLLVTVMGTLVKLSNLGLKTVYEDNADLLEDDPEPVEDEVCGIDNNPIAEPAQKLEWDF